MQLGFVGAAAAALVIASGSAQAQQIFKCTEHGKTVFSDHPCGETARELDVRPARGGYDPGAAARIRSQTERLNSQFDAEDRARDAARRAASDPRRARRCEVLGGRVQAQGQRPA